MSHICEHGYAERGANGKCKICHRQQMAAARAGRRVHYRRLKVLSELRLRYGLTPDNYAAMFSAQHGKCGICHRELISCLDDSRAFGQGPQAHTASVDHDHQNGRIRGLLCSNCNHALGKFRDNPTLLLNAVRYLGESRTAQAQPVAGRESASEIGAGKPGPRVERSRGSRRDELSPFLD